MPTPTQIAKAATSSATNNIMPFIEDLQKKNQELEVRMDCLQKEELPVNKMNFNQTFSREQLQSIPAKRRLEAIAQYIETHITTNVQLTASLGKTSYFYKLEKVKPMGSSYPPPYQVTNEDIVEGLLLKFPGCTVNYTEDWIEVRPGVREQQKGINIDWS